MYNEDMEYIDLRKLDRSVKEQIRKQIVRLKERGEKGKEIESWTEYTKPVTVHPNHKYIVYASIIDKTGNNTVINTEGLVLENVFPSIGSITDGGVYCEAQMVDIADEYLDTFTVDGKVTELTDGTCPFFSYA